MSTYPPAALAEAVQLLERGELAAAGRRVNALPGHDDDPDALHLLGLIRLQQSRPEETLALLRRSLILRPGHPDVRLNLAKALRVVNRDAEAASLLVDLTDTHPALAEAWSELGMIALRAADQSAAGTYFRKALEKEPGHPLALLWQGVALRNEGRNEEAERGLAEGLSLAGEPRLRGAFVYNLAHAQYGQGKMESALENFALANRLDPGLNAGINRADILEEMLRFDEAEAVLEELVRREPVNAAAHDAYNNLLHRMGRDQEFLTSYDRAPQTTELHAAKAGLLLKSGRQEEAHALFIGITARDPGNLEAAIGAATALNELGRPGEGMLHLERALPHHPTNAILYHNLAATALQARDPQKAVAMAEKSLILSPVDQTGLAVLGSAWRAMGDERDELLNGYDELIRVFDLEPPRGFSSMADFNAELNAWLDTRHPRTREPLQQSLRSGSQTRGHMFAQGHDLVERLRLRIEEAITRYIAETGPDARHPFRGRCGHGFRFASSWSSRLKDCGYHVNHIHPGGWISSCYYVALPETVKDQEGKQGWIKFGEPSFDAGLGVRRAVQPLPGRLVLFPSYMWHGTVPFHENATRTTIAFDAVPRG
ncbi:MAG TPA: tetratricopeptide repeat protein [Rhizomicrobium sp.]|nr:tetratricopeptide repeat protein [Rhizomicrobium sp.]